MTLPRPFNLSARCLSLLALALPLCTACDNGCEQTRENYLKLTFTSTSGRTLRSMSFIMLSGDKVTETKSIQKFTDIDFDINPNESCTRICIQSNYSDYGDSYSVRDTIDVTYTTEARFLDLSCGCTVNYEIQDVVSTHHLLGQMTINNAQVFDGSGTNITFEY